MVAHFRFLLLLVCRLLHWRLQLSERREGFRVSRFFRFFIYLFKFRAVDYPRFRKWNNGPSFDIHHQSDYQNLIRFFFFLVDTDFNV